MRTKPQGEIAEHLRDSDISLALQALAFVASHPTLLARFLDLTGLSPDDLRAQAQEAQLHIAVLDFLLAHEPDLAKFCTSIGCDMTLPASVRARLAAETRGDFA